MKAVRRKFRGRIPNAPAEPVLPRHVAYLWRVFQDLHMTRPVGFGGPLPIQYAEIDAYQRTLRFALAPWEVNALKLLDADYLTIYHEDAQKQIPKPGR